MPRTSSIIALSSLLAILSLLPGARAQPISCSCDCDGDQRVAVAELVSAVNVLLGRTNLSSCTAADPDGDGQVSVGELIQGVNAALSGCQHQSPTPTPVPTATRMPDQQIPPTGGDALLAWLEAGNYLNWQAESQSHASLGPHFGAVRTFVNDALLASLDAGQADHPLGAAAVKELYGQGSEVQGWAVSLKVDADSNGGLGWYWYERFGSSVFADAVGTSLCSGCHSRDTSVVTSKDFVLIPFPLQ